MNRLLLLEPLKKNIAIALILGVFFNLSHLVYPVYMLQVYDKVLTSYNKETLFYLIALAIILSILGALLDSTRKSLLTGVSLKIQNENTHNVMHELQKAEKGQNDTFSYFRSFQTILNYISSGHINTLLDLIWSPLFLIALYIIHPVLGVSAFVGVTLIIIASVYGEHRTEKLHEHSDALSEELHQLEKQYTKNYDILMGSTLSNTYHTRTLSNHQPFYKTKIQLTQITNRVHAFNSSVRQVCQVLILGLGALLVIEGGLSASLMIVATIIYGRAIQPFTNIASVYKQSKRVLREYKHFKSIQEVSCGESQKTYRLESNAIKIDKLVVTLPNESKPIIKGISFTTEPGDLIAIHGDSCSGKSTLLKALAGIWKPSNGVVSIDNLSTYDWIRNDINKPISYLSQKSKLFPGTIQENIASFQEFDDKDIIKASKLTGLHKYILMLPLGYETVITEQSQFISKGVYQLICLTRAVFGSPKVLLLDEPYSNISVFMKEEVQKAWASLQREGVTIVISTSLTAPFNLSHKRLIIDSGMIQKFEQVNIQTTNQKIENISKLENAS